MVDRLTVAEPSRRRRLWKACGRTRSPASAKKLLVVAGALGLVIGVAACGSSGSDTTSATAGEGETYVPDESNYQAFFKAKWKKEFGIE